MSQRILIVDDDEPTRQALSSRLREAEYAVTATGDPQAAIDLLGRSRFDLLIVSVLMETMDGTHLLAWLESQTDRPAVMTLASAHEHLPLEMTTLLGRTYAHATAVEKPVHIERLLPLVDKIMQSRAAMPAPQKAPA